MTNLFIAAVNLGFERVRSARAEFENTRRALASAFAAADRLLRWLLAQQAMSSMTAAMDLPETSS